MSEYIEKKAAIEAILGQPPEAHYPVWYAGDILGIPPADVRPVVRGRWIEYDDDYGAYCCSVCEQDAPEDTQWPYCPNCGADMREDKP